MSIKELGFYSVKSSVEAEFQGACSVSVKPEPNSQKSHSASFYRKPNIWLRLIFGRIIRLRLLFTQAQKFESQFFLEQLYFLGAREGCTLKSFKLFFSLLKKGNWNILKVSKL